MSEADTSEVGAMIRCGFVAIVGRPNVGKSTLMNRLIGQKVSITSRKPQTTRHRITGVQTRADAQFVFVDTPGFQTRHGGALNASLNRTVKATLGEVDAVVFVVEAGRFGPEDEQVLGLLPSDRPVVLAINKVDRTPDKARLLPFAQAMAGRFTFADILPVSAQQGTQTDTLLDVLAPHLPESEPMFGANDLTDRTSRFLVAELLREKVFRMTGDEVPYGTTVVIEKYEELGNLVRVCAAILVDKPAHKGMLIGRGGERLKQICSVARADMEKLLGCKVFLEVWVKVRSGWAEDTSNLRQLGYE
jgi:GTP-binding protein Era